MCPLTRNKLTGGALRRTVSVLLLAYFIACCGMFLASLLQGALWIIKHQWTTAARWNDVNWIVGKIIVIKHQRWTNIGSCDNSRLAVLKRHGGDHSKWSNSCNSRRRSCAEQTGDFFLCYSDQSSNRVCLRFTSHQAKIFPDVFWLPNHWCA